ncbi:hypothetical protein QQ045_000504 [Rhodiola kirilowii]
MSSYSSFIFLVLDLVLATCWRVKAAEKIGAGYSLVSIEKMADGGLLGLLKINEKNDLYGPDIKLLQHYIKHETDLRLRIHITDAEKPRWELILTYTSNPFGFAVRRKSNNDVVFNTTFDSSDSFNNLVFKDQYLEITTKLPKSASLYGLGENTQPHGIKIRPNEPYTLYTTDVSAITLNTDLYGSHPVYMDLRNLNGEAYAHGVLLLNSNGTDVFYRGDSLTYKVIGGVFHFYFFAGELPLAVVDQYTQLIGQPAPMPYWAFGFLKLEFVARWGYHNLSVVEDVVVNYEKAKIPPDVIWNDDNHMDAKKDFTLDPIDYLRQKLLAFLDKIHSKGMKYIVINDPGIAVNASYGVHNRGMAQDVFIKYEGEPYLGQWIDINEASNFCSGKCAIPEGIKCPSVSGPGWECCLDCKNMTKTIWDDPPYKINASGKVAPIGYKTIATGATHYNGVLEYDAHSIYGFSQAIATHKAMQRLEGKMTFILSRSTFAGSGKGKMTFILSRSTFAGSGKYVAHWTGDNQGT